MSAGLYKGTEVGGWGGGPIKSNLKPAREDSQGEGGIFHVHVGLISVALGPRNIGRYPWH